MLGVLMFHFFFLLHRSDGCGILSLLTTPNLKLNFISKTTIINLSQHIQQPQQMQFLGANCCTFPLFLPGPSRFHTVLLVEVLFEKSCLCVSPNLLSLLEPKVCVLFICFLYWALPKSSLKRGSIASKIFRNYCSNPDD